MFNMSMRMSMNTSAGLYVYAHACTQPNICLCTRLYTYLPHMSMSVYTHSPTHTCAYTCLYEGVYTCLCTCPCTCLCTQMIYRFVHYALSNVPVTINTSPASCTSDRATVVVLTQNPSQGRLGFHHRLHCSQPLE